MWCKKKQKEKPKLDDPLWVIQSQIDWYNKQADNSKWKHSALKISILILSASIPVIACCALPDAYKNFVIAIIGALVTIFAGISELFKFNEKRLKYRNVANELVCAQYWHYAKGGVTPLKLLEKVVKIIEKGHKMWAENMQEEINSGKGNNPPEQL